MKVTTDACLFGAWVAREARSLIPIAIGTEVGRVLDIGTGTGLLSLILAQSNAELFFDSIEINKEAAEQAEENVKASPWKERITVINADARSFQFEHEYDLIISNPPFYEKEIRSAKEIKNIAHHSDELNLDELLAAIKKHLAASGKFFLLLPYKRNEEIKKLFKDHQLHIDKIVFVRQSVNHDYFRIMLKGELYRKENKETAFDEISIWDEEQQYTTEFVGLLKDYYLHL